MGRRSVWLLVVSLPVLLLSAAPVAAQRTTFGVYVGPSVVGGGASRVPVTADGVAFTGGDQHGWQAGLLLGRQLQGTPLSVRAELFHNRLSSRPNTFSTIGGTDVATALTDQVTALMVGLSVHGRKVGRLLPYATAGAGIMRSVLGTNPDASSDEVTVRTSQTAAGLSFGGGARFDGWDRSFFLEARYQQSLGNQRGSGFIPIVFGISF